MRILIINSRYFLSAGPEKYMFGLKEMLEKNGHEVIPFSVRNSRNEKSRFEEYFAEPIGGGDKVFYSEYRKDPKTMMQMLGREFYSFHVRKRLDSLIKETRPDIAYILHHYNKLSPSVIDACKNNSLPVVMRLSDFFLLCPESHFYRDRGVCEECVDHSLFRAVRHRCVKGSIILSGIKAMALKFHRLLGVYSRLDFVVIQSRFTISRMKKAISPEKISFNPTFIARTEGFNGSIGDYLLHVGRIEEQKGIIHAIKAVENTGYALKIVGSSSTGHEAELRKYVKDKRIDNVKFLGPKYGEELDSLYRGSRAVIIPAIWYENMPNVALEAMMHSRPILASGLGSLKELVRDGENGLLFEPGNAHQIREKIEMIFDDDALCSRLGKNSYADAVEKYSPKKHYEVLLDVFSRAVSKKDKKLKMD